jgi:hypothetical protein
VSALTWQIQSLLANATADLAVLGHSLEVWPVTGFYVTHAGFARAAALKQAEDLPSFSLPAANAQKPGVAGLIKHKAASKKGAAYSEALSAEGAEALRQAVKQLRRTIFSTEQLRCASQISLQQKQSSSAQL